MKRWIIRVHGKVQGVFFRQTALEEAHRLGLAGLVRNEPDGTVYIEAEGSDDMLQQFLDWCWNGPSAARVDNVEVEEVEPKHYEYFSTE